MDKDKAYPSERSQLVDTVAKAKVTPVGGEIDRQSFLLEELGAAINGLESKINPVLNGGVPESPDDNKPPEGESSVYNILSKNNLTITRLTDWVNKTARRVEL